MSDSTITIEQARNTLNIARRDHAASLKAFESVNDGKHDMVAMIEAADTVKSCTASLARAEAVVKTAEFAQFTGERNEAIQRIHDVIKASITAERAALVKCGVETLIPARIDLTLDSPPVSIAAHGPGLKAPKGAPRTGSGEGFKSAGAVNVDGTEYRSLNAAYMALRAAADGVEPGAITPANSESAHRWLTKAGHAVEAVNAA